VDSVGERGVGEGGVISGSAWRALCGCGLAIPGPHVAASGQARPRPPY
jgi:hypothetical protein